MSPRTQALGWGRRRESISPGGATEIKVRERILSPLRGFSDTATIHRGISLARRKRVQPFLTAPRHGVCFAFSTTTGQHILLGEVEELF